MYEAIVLLPFKIVHSFNPGRINFHW